MEARKLRRWAIARTRDDGVEELAMFYPLYAMTKDEMAPVLRGMLHLNPELDGKLRIVPVVVDIREMTEEEGNAFRKSLSQQEYGSDPPPESL
jgi:hypothetical protein